MCIPRKMPAYPSSIASVASEHAEQSMSSPPHIAAATALHAGLAADSSILSAWAGEAKQSRAAPEEQAPACRPNRRVSEETGPAAQRA